MLRFTFLFLANISLFGRMNENEQARQLLQYIPEIECEYLNIAETLSTLRHTDRLSM